MSGKHAKDGSGRGQTPSVRPRLPRKASNGLGPVVFCERIDPPAEDAEDLRAARLVIRFQAGEQDAFVELYREYFDRVYAYLRVVLKDTHEAEDTAQQVFMKVFQALPDYERRRAFWAWLFTVARNHALNRIRDSRRTDVIEPEEVDRRREPIEREEASLPSLDWVTDQDLLVLIERLPLAQRQVLTMRHLFDLSTKEIAEIMERTVDDVRMLQHRGQRFLRDRLTAIGRGPRPSRRTRMRSRIPEAVVLRARRFSIR